MCFTEPSSGTSAPGGPVQIPAAARNTHAELGNGSQMLRVFLSFLALIFPPQFLGVFGETCGGRGGAAKRLL